MKKAVFAPIRAAGIYAGFVAFALCLSVSVPDAMAQVYNKEGSAASAPLFIDQKPAQASGMVGGILPSQKTYGMNSAKVSAPTAARAANYYEQQVAKQQAYNRQVRDSRSAALKAEFEANRAQVNAEDAARMQMEYQAFLQKQAGQQGGAAAKSDETAPTQPVTRPSSNPYPGSNVVFTGRQTEESQKPVRLFNTR